MNDTTSFQRGQSCLKLLQKLLQLNTQQLTLHIRPKTGTSSRKISTKDSTRASNTRRLRVTVRLLWLTFATTLKVSNYTATSSSGTHRYALGGEAGSHRGYVRYIHVQCSRLGCELCKPLNTGTGWCGLEIGGFRCVGCVGVCGYVLVMV